MTTEVQTALKSSDDLEYWNGKQAAQKLGIDLWDTFWERLKQNPLDGSAWYDVTANAKESNVDEIIDFAIKKFTTRIFRFWTKRFNRYWR